MLYEADPSVRRALNEHHHTYLASEFRAAKTTFGRLNLQAFSRRMQNLFIGKHLRKRYGKSLTQQRRVPT